MALTKSQLSLLASGPAGKVFHYYSADTKATIVAANYFAGVYEMLNPGDIVHCRAVVGGTEVHFDLSVLTASSSGVTVLAGADKA